MTVALKWKCDGDKCSKLLTDGVDRYAILKYSEGPAQGQLIRLCVKCQTQLRREKPNDKS